MTISKILETANAPTSPTRSPQITPTRPIIPVNFKPAKKGKGNGKKTNLQTSADCSKNVTTVDTTAVVNTVPRQLQVINNSLSDSGPQGLTASQSSLNESTSSQLSQVQTTNATLSPPSAKAADSRFQGETSLRAAPPRTAALHLFNFNIETTVEDIVGHVKKFIKTSEVHCEKLVTRGDYSSFKLNVPTASFKVIRDFKIWPAGVSIRKFNDITSKNIRPQLQRKHV
ncbi:hypothetical protein O0L34_g4350 [Tuta absoluta]|nr:hypothetical protein O0L34_g4350 [Tuta absoluta]